MGSSGIQIPDYQRLNPAASPSPGFFSTRQLRDSLQPTVNLVSQNRAPHRGTSVRLNLATLYEQRTSATSPLEPTVSQQRGLLSNQILSFMNPHNLDLSITQLPNSRKLKPRPRGTESDRQFHDALPPAPSGLRPIRVPYRENSTQSTAMDRYEPGYKEREERYQARYKNLSDHELLELEVEERSQKALDGWKPTSHPIEKLTTLPVRIDHPGAERYIGSELKGRLKYLWDNNTGTTVLATNEIFDQSYVAVSYTWGRWKDDWYRVKRTLWDVPSIRSKSPASPKVVCNLIMRQLTDILRRMPNVRYFWIDVLCIPQKPSNAKMERVKEEKIAKQGAIFNSKCPRISLVHR